MIIKVEGHIMVLGKTSQKVAFWDCLQKLRLQETDIDEENTKI